MKRIEMLSVIELTLEDYLGEKIHHPDVLADLILKDIEKAGMLPPHADGDRYYHCYECGGDSVFRWEPESDKDDYERQRSE